MAIAYNMTRQEIDAAGEHKAEHRGQDERLQDFPDLAPIDAISPALWVRFVAARKAFQLKVQPRRAPLINLL
jgi:hypothetical protein